MFGMSTLPEYVPAPTVTVSPQAFESAVALAIAPLIVAQAEAEAVQAFELLPVGPTKYSVAETGDASARMAMQNRSAERYKVIPNHLVHRRRTLARLQFACQQISQEMACRS